MELQLELAQKQILSQRMIQSMEVLQLSAQELETYIQNLALENPVIDLKENNAEMPDQKDEDLKRKLEWLESTDLQNRVYYQQESNFEGIENSWHDKREMEETLEEYLVSQIITSGYNRVEDAIIRFMIASLNPNGYYIEETYETAQYFGVEEELIERLLNDIQALVPAGVGARNLSECLLLQLRRQPDYSEITEKIIADYLPEVGKNHLQDIAKKLKVSIDEVNAACTQIRQLNPKPGSSFSNREQLKYIAPDAIVVKLEGAFEILINEYQYPSFDISSYYENMLKETDDEEAKKYLTDKINQAKWVRDCISQRASTLSRVMNVLVEIQNDFFLNGPGHKAPMRLVDIADRLGLHESTISRTLRSKYLQCSWGVFPLNYFLTSVAVKSKASGEEQTQDQVKIKIKELVDNENKKKPLSDQAISDALIKMGINISRRTVNKYRVEMGLPDKSGRKQW